MRAREALRLAAARLGGATARLDAELLLAHLLGVERSALLLSHLDDAIDAEGYEALLARRAGGEPVAYITGEREFWSLPLHVTPATLIPRPDSETLVEAALAGCPAPARVLDLGTGSGCLLLAVLSERPGAFGVGIDRSEAAVRVARDNAARLGLAGRAAFVVGDWAAAVGVRFDLVLCNPPYIGVNEPLPRDVAAFEPATALYAGGDGLAAYRRLIPQLVAILGRDGRAYLEIGHAQADVVSRLAEDVGLAPHVVCDLEGRPRCVSLAHLAN